MSTDLHLEPHLRRQMSGMSESTVYNLLREGKIEGRKRGASMPVLMDGLRRYVEGLPKATFVGQKGA